MPYTITTALEEPSISHAAQLHSEFVVQIGDLRTRVTIRIWKLVTGSGFYFTQSHFIKTPVQGTPYQTDAVWADSDADALHLAVQTLTRFFDDAVRVGRTPIEDWLVANEHF